MSSDQPTVPYGYCQCGCGKPVPASKVTRRDRGIVKGGPIRYLRGHQPKRQGRPLDDSCYRIEDRGYKTPCWTCVPVLHAATAGDEVGSDPAALAVVFWQTATGSA